MDRGRSSLSRLVTLTVTSSPSFQRRVGAGDLAVDGEDTAGLAFDATSVRSITRS